MVQQAIDTFGGLDVLICNAGILRDKMSFNMTEEEFDSVIRVHLKGHFAPIRFAGAYWRAKAKETGEPTNAAVVTTASESGLYGNAGQVNYAAAKAGIASMTIVLARELGRSGVRVNSIAPVAATRLLGTVGQGEELADNPMMSPDNPAAGAVWLASPLADGVTGQVLKIMGGVAQILDGWRPATQISSGEKWTLQSLADGRDLLFKDRDPGVPRSAPWRSSTTRPPERDRRLSQSGGAQPVVVDRVRDDGTLELLHVEELEARRAARSARRPRCRRRARSDRPGTAPSPRAGGACRRRTRVPRRGVTTAVAGSSAASRTPRRRCSRDRRAPARPRRAPARAGRRTPSCRRCRSSRGCGAPRWSIARRPASGTIRASRWSRRGAYDAGDAPSLASSRRVVGEHRHGAADAELGRVLERLDRGVHRAGGRDGAGEEAPGEDRRPRSRARRRTSPRGGCRRRTRCGRRW